jgi:hypothetical protein
MCGAYSLFRPRRSWAILTVVAGLALAGGLRAQPPRNDLLDRARRVNAIIAQRLESDVRGAIFQAQRLAATQPDKAVDKLKSALSKLEDDTALPEERRRSLKRMLQKRMEAIRVGADAQALNEKQLLADIRRFEHKKAAQDRGAEDEKVRRGMSEILDLQKNGKLADAKRLAEELARQHPGHPAARNLLYTTTAFDQLASARGVRRDKVDRTARALQDIERSSIAPSGDMEFPKDWKERTKGRTASLVQLTSKEKAILRALNTPLTVNFKDDRFQDAMEYLSTALGQPILLTKAPWPTPR